MRDFQKFLEHMGGLHDAVVRQLVWTPDAKILRIDVEDMFANFEGFPEYPGGLPGCIELLEVEKVSIGIDTSESQLNIDEFVVELQNDGKCFSSISFWPGGRITALHRLAKFPDGNKNN